MRIYISEESSKKLDKAADRRQISPEDRLDRMVTDADEADQREDDANAAATATDGKSE